MLRRLFSKRSGFTLVEIIVAMVIFAIMATMVAQILQLAAKARMENNAYGSELAGQEEKLAKIEKDANAFQNKTDDYTLAFKKADGTEIGEVKLAYEIKDADGSATAEGINYFVSPVKYDGKLENGSSGDPNNVKTVVVDARIIGTEGLQQITIQKVTKQASPVEGAAVRYYFETKAKAKSGVSQQELELAYYQLRFYMTDTLDSIKSAAIRERENSDGTITKYTMDVPAQAKIIGVGNGTENNQNTNNGPAASRSSSNCVTVSALTESGSVNDITKTAYFYVDFVEDPQIDASSFGSQSGGNSNVSQTYSLYKGSNNIFGAYEYVMHELDGNEDT